MKSVRLKGEEGERWLRLDEHGLWLMESEDAIDGLDALKETPRYVSGRLKDKLQARGETFGIPAGKGGEVREMIAIARLRGPSHALLTGPFIDTTHELERAFVSGWLEPEEQLLAFLQTTSSLEVGSAVGDASEVEARVVWTDRRAALVAIGPLGDLREHPLVDALIVESVTGRDTVRCGELDWKTTLFNESRYAKLVEVWASPPPERLRFARTRPLPPENATSHGAMSVRCRILSRASRPRSSTAPSSSMRTYLWEVFSKTSPHGAEPRGSPLRVRTLRVRGKCRGHSPKVFLRKTRSRDWTCWPGRTRGASTSTRARACVTRCSRAIRRARRV